MLARSATLWSTIPVTSLQTLSEYRMLHLTSIRRTDALSDPNVRSCAAYALLRACVYIYLT